VLALQLLATFSAALFAGAALYISLVEHPARMQLETRIAAAQWAPSYARATWMQAPLALLSFLAGTTSWLMGAGAAWLIAAVVPFTLVVIHPTNHQLLDPTHHRSSAETRVLLERWGRLHAVRTGLSLAAAATYLLSLSRA